MIGTLYLIAEIDYTTQPLRFVPGIAPTFCYAVVVRAAAVVSAIDTGANASVGL